jgi:hypothetical protein
MRDIRKSQYDTSFEPPANGILLFSELGNILRVRRSTWLSQWPRVSTDRCKCKKGESLLLFSDGKKVMGRNGSTFARTDGRRSSLLFAPEEHFVRLW